MSDNQFLYFSIFGFFASITAFAYFAVLYRDIFKDKRYSSTGKPPKRQTAENPKPGVSNNDLEQDTSTNVKSEIDGLQIKIDEIKNTVAEKQQFQQMQIKQIVSEINSLIEKIEKLPPHYTETISPHLDMLVAELETVRKLQLD